MGAEAFLTLQIVDFAEGVDDRVAALLQAGTGITLTYNDGAGTLTIANTGLGGSTGSTDNRILRSDGTGGATVQNSAVTIDDSGNISGLGTISGSGVATIGGVTVGDSANNVPTIRTTFNTTGFGFEGQYGSAINFIHGGTRYYAATDSGFQIADSVPLRFRVLGSTTRGEIWGTSASQIDIRANSGLRLRNLANSAAGALDCGAITASGVVLLPNGSAAAPALAFSGDTDSGFYWGGANTLNIGLGGSIRQQFQSDGSIQLTGTDPWLYSGNWAIRSSGSGVILLRASNGSTPATVDCGAITASGALNVNNASGIYESGSGRTVAFTSNFSASTPGIGTTTNHAFCIYTNGANERLRFAATGAITASSTLAVGVFTVATLPSAAANAGALAQVTDSSVTTNGSAVSGGGANRVVVFSNGSTWDVVVA